MAKYLHMLTVMSKKEKYRRDSIDSDISKNIYIPSCIFSQKLSSTETIIKFLKESYDLNFQQIASLLNKKRQSVWRSYKSAAKKHKEALQVTNLFYPIPIHIFKDSKLSLLETLVVFLKDSHKLTFSEISAILMRDQRTVWTSYSRARKKNAK